ncbi:putative D-isomer specific 2-hydroxyacid dehydrogenase NAD-binding domain-containing protein [Seiridium cardinale]
MSDNITEAKPTVLLVESDVRGEDPPDWHRVLSKFHVIYYDCKDVDEFCERLAPGQPYATINAIVRTGWLKSGAFAEHRLFEGKPLVSYPSTLRLITCSGHGYDAADIDALSRKGIAYANTPNTCTEAVANTALHLILNTYRYFTLAEHYTRTSQWPSSREIGQMAVEPCGQILGIVGLGDIGMTIAKKAAGALDMKIHYHNRTRRPDAEAKLSDGAVYHETVESLMNVADCLCLACPLTPETRHMVSASSLGRLGSRKIRIVNIARGGLIDEDALLEAMDAGRVIGIGLDVHANEPGINPRLRNNYRTTVLPHIGVASRTTWGQFDEVNIRNLDEFFFGNKEKVTIVNRL